MRYEPITDEQIEEIEKLPAHLSIVYANFIARIRADAKTIKELEDYKWMYEDLCK